MWESWEIYIEFWSEDLKGRDLCYDLGMDGKLSYNELQEMGQEVVDWIFLTLDWDQWQAIVTTVVTCRELINWADAEGCLWMQWKEFCEQWVGKDLEGVSQGLFECTIWLLGLSMWYLIL